MRLAPSSGPELGDPFMDSFRVLGVSLEAGFNWLAGCYFLGKVGLRW